jgi:hypothetical protein
LGERLLCKQEVVGSIPSGSTRRPNETGERAGLSAAPGSHPGSNASHVRQQLRRAKHPRAIFVIVKRECIRSGFVMDPPAMFSSVLR